MVSFTDAVTPSDFKNRGPSPAELCALRYAVGIQTQKELFKRFGISYSEYRHAREKLELEGMIRPDGSLIETGLDLIPSYEWIDILETFRQRLEESQQAAIARNAQISDFRSIISDLQTAVTRLQEENSALTSASEETKDLSEILDRFSPITINPHWVRSVIALTLIEAAMKKKLEDSGGIVEARPSFGQLRESLQQTLQKEEGRELRHRLLGLSNYPKTLSRCRRRYQTRAHANCSRPKKF